ncbi:hypothetical protein IE53DRAFT_385573 [Violaceomyces palustris]|uniref:Uncharacterized protein n=1 Tax=Violaceomyces palustris TaxID=1673888 RepID=A0ACD0P1J6_9BASI|nr:hypothetical protein IE53DRAFT_385573 [Violaceomyces palustris]
MSQSAGRRRNVPPRSPFGLRLHPSVAPMTLLMVATSFAFNNALIHRSREEERRLHASQVGVLNDLILFLDRPTSSRRMSSNEGEEEREERKYLFKRVRNVGLDPVSLGLLPTRSPSSSSSSSSSRFDSISDVAGSRGDSSKDANEMTRDQEQQDEPFPSSFHQGPRKITWGEIFFGKPGSVTENFKGVVSGIRETFSNGLDFAGQRVMREGGGRGKGEGENEDVLGWNLLDPEEQETVRRELKEAKEMDK